LHEPSRDAHQYKVVTDPRGTLLAFRGPRPQGYDAATNAFRPAGRDLPADPDDVLIRANGDLWWIDLLKAVHGPHATFPIRSSSYPGRDPRHLVEDARGGLWVVDFESGLFRLGDTGGFVHEPGLDDKGSGVAVDAE